MTGTAAVRLERVGKRYSRRGRWVLDGIDLVAVAGTLTVVAGGNGSGKSTLLRLVAGASQPTAGRVTARPDSVGYVPERLPARLRMTATQYVAHMGRIRGLDGDEVAERSRMLFECLDLSPGPDWPIRSLSKGNNQKVALAQALLAPVGLLVLDEPYSGLDAAARRMTAGLLAEARTAGATVVVSTHDPDAVVGADGRYVVANGRLEPVARQPDPVWRPTMRVVLRATDDRAAAHELAAAPGVVAADYDELGRTLTVRTRDADTLVSHALGDGWSLTLAEPETGAVGGEGG